MSAEQHRLFGADEPQPGEYAIPLGVEPTSCRSCGAAIVWTRTAAGKAIPLSLTSVRRVGDQRLAKTHFIDCPNGREWRKH